MAWWNISSHCYKLIALLWMSSFGREEVFYNNNFTSLMFPVEIITYWPVPRNYILRSSFHLYEETLLTWHHNLLVTLSVHLDQFTVNALVIYCDAHIYYFNLSNMKNACWIWFLCLPKDIAVFPFVNFLFAQLRPENSLSFCKIRLSGPLRITCIISSMSLISYWNCSVDLLYFFFHP